MAEPRPERKIIIIPAKKESPQEQAKKRNLRVAAYCRVSTGDEEQLTSYENQKAFYTEKIMKNPDWTMVDIFADEGITGTSTCRRKQFLRMIRQCRQGKIDMILAKSVSRFARNTLDTISYTRELRGLGIAVIFEEQNINSIYPESEFLIALHAAFAQSESESISANVRWGKRQSIKDGKVTFQYKTMLGYKKGVDGIVIAAVVFLCIPWESARIPFVIIALSHFFIDWIRVYVDKKHEAPAAHFSSFVIDQVLHIAIIYGSVRIFGLDEQTRNWLTDLALTFPVEQILRYSLIFIIILDPASVFVKKLSIYVTGGTSGGHKKAPPVGSVIGKLERILTVILVLCNQIGAIGFVLTAKSLARYKQLDDQSFAEKYLVGTLSSTTIAIIAALLLK